MADEPAGGLADRFRVREWFIAFHRTSPVRLARWLTVGQTFKHVSCFAFVPAAGCWIFNDWNLLRSELLIVPDAKADPFLAAEQEDAVVLRHVPAAFPLMRPKLGFWCVTSVAHLAEIRSCALRPDALFRDCLAEGAEIVAGETDGQTSETAVGPGAVARAAGGAL